MYSSIVLPILVFLMIIVIIIIIIINVIIVVDVVVVASILDGVSLILFYFKLSLKQLKILNKINWIVHSIMRTQSYVCKTARS